MSYQTARLAGGDEKKDKLVVGPRNWFLGTMSGYRTNIMPEEWKRI